MPDESSGIIPAGTLFMLSYGEYEDYCIQGIFRACANIDVTAVQAEFLRQHPEQAKDKVWLRVRDAVAGQPDLRSPTRVRRS